MAISDHPSFDRPPVTTKLWRYMDLPKFVDLLTSSKLWLTNAEILAVDDPYEGLPGAVQFPHRMWRTMDEVPAMLQRQILEMCGRGTDGTPEAVFKSWFMGEEQRCFMTRSGRRNFFVNCWHAADHESVAMWKIYGTPGAGVAVISNGGRLNSSISPDSNVYLGAVKYVDPDVFEIGTPNALDMITKKRASYGYEQEVRLVHWHTGEYHDPLANFAWDEESMRFTDLVEDPRPILPGISIECDLNVLIENVIVSPFAPPWYAATVERLRDQLGGKFTISASTLLKAPVVIE